MNGGVAGTRPVNPGTKPHDPLAGPLTEAAAKKLPFVAAESIRLFNDQRQLYQQYNTVETLLRNMILKSVEDKYTKALKHARTKYQQVTPLALMDHLWTTYGGVDSNDLGANEARMNSLWHPPTTIEILFEQLTDGQEYALVGAEVLHDDQLVRWGYENIKNTGLFTHKCQKWRERKPVDRSWDDFKEFFEKSDKDYRKNNPTTSTELYSANAAEACPYPVPASSQEAKISELVQNEFNKYICTQINEDVPQAPPPPPPTANVAVTMADLQKLLAEAKADINPRGPKNRGRKPQARQKAQALADGVPVTYCWTHGITANLSQNSKTCKRPAENHKREATHSNRMGGSNEVCETRN